MLMINIPIPSSVIKRGWLENPRRNWGRLASNHLQMGVRFPLPCLTTWGYTGYIMKINPHHRFGERIIVRIGEHQPRGFINSPFFCQERTVSQPTPLGSCKWAINIAIVDLLQLLRSSIGLKYHKHPHILLADMCCLIIIQVVRIPKLGVTLNIWDIFDKWWLTDGWLDLKGVILPRLFWMKMSQSIVGKPLNYYNEIG